MIIAAPTNDGQIFTIAYFYRRRSEPAGRSWEMPGIHETTATLPRRGQIDPPPSVRRDSLLT